MSLGGLIGVVVFYIILVFLFVKLGQWSRNDDDLNNTDKAVIRYGRYGIVLIFCVSVVLNLGYFGIIKVPDALRGPVAGNELPATQARDIPAKVAAPPPSAAPIQPSAGAAMDEHHKQLENLKNKP